MRTLSASELLNVWEQGRTRQPFERARLLLAAAYPETPADALETLPLGGCVSRLLTLRESLFGATMISVTSCPQCNERMEFTLDVSDLHGKSEIERNDEVLSLNVDDYDVSLRLPNSSDVAVLAKHENRIEARYLLLQRCLLSGRYNGEERCFKDLPEEVMNAVVREMESADPLAHIDLSLSCPLCGHRWAAPFEIVTFLWSEITTWARRILREVHLLASSYGWSENDVLALNPYRRQYYLELIKG